MVAGAGAIAQAAAYMRQMNRDMERRVRARQVQRQVYHKARMKALIDGVSFEPPRSYVSMAEYPCFAMCCDCGFLSMEQRGPCPSCDGMDRINLRDDNLAQLQRETEERERHNVPRWVRISVVGILLCTAALAMVLLYDPLGKLVSLFLPLGFVVYLFTVRPMAWVLQKLQGRLRTARPIRWRLPLSAPPEKNATVSTTVAVPEPQANFVAPFSGVECLGYKLSVRFDADGDLRPPEWILAEEQVADFEIDGHKIVGEKVHIEAPLDAVSPGDCQRPGFSLSAFLRERGLFLHDGQFELYEAVLPLDAPLSIQMYESTDAVLVSVA